jgi:hypothetical protein
MYDLNVIISAAEGPLAVIRYWYFVPDAVYQHFLESSLVYGATRSKAGGLLHGFGPFLLEMTSRHKAYFPPMSVILLLLRQDLASREFARDWHFCSLES